MRILIHGLNYLPELTGIGKYSGEMAEWFAEQGHEVRVVVAPPYYPEWRVNSGYSAWHYSKEYFGGVTVLRCPIWVPRKPSTLKRIIHLASFSLSSFPVMLSQVMWRPNVVLVVEPPIFCAPQAWLTARLSSGKAHLHIQDFEIDAAVGLGMVSSGRLNKVIAATESLLMRCFDKVTTVSRPMIERVRAKRVPEDRIELFPNWVDTQVIFPDRAAGINLRQALDIDKDNIVALYSGNLGEKQGLEILIEAAIGLRDHRDLLFIICGEGSAKERLQLMAKDLINVRFFPLQPISKLNMLLNMADIHLLPQRSDAADLVMPSKLTGILSAGGPLIATANEGTEVATVVGAAGGLLCPPGDRAGLIQAIVALKTDPARRENMREKARKYAQKYLEKDSVLRSLEQSLEALFQSPQPKFD